MKANECKYCKITMQLIEQARREGWEQAKREAKIALLETNDQPGPAIDAIAAMEYKEPAK